jgi:probable phosphoglycerate mutase
MSNTRLMLVRHGESRATIEKFFGGARSCTGLTDNGRRQAEALRDRLMAGRDVQATALYSSKHSRAVETAQIITPALGSLSLKTDSGWGEHDPGPDIDGMPYDDFVALYGVPRWDGDPHDVVFPGGETVSVFHERVMETLRNTVRENIGGNVVVVCHAGVIDAVLRNTLQMHQTGKLELHSNNTSLTELLHVQGSKWRLVRFNDSAHLAEQFGIHLRTSEG